MCLKQSQNWQFETKNVGEKKTYSGIFGSYLKICVWLITNSPREFCELKYNGPRYKDNKIFGSQDNKGLTMITECDINTYVI